MCWLGYLVRCAVNQQNPRWRINTYVKNAGIKSFGIIQTLNYRKILHFVIIVTHDDETQTY
jgi:hypothetical protein